MALVKRTAHVAIRRGENRGKHLTYYNVVRELKSVGTWNGKAMTIKLPNHKTMQRGSEFCTILVQQGRSGPIIGAAELTEW